MTYPTKAELDARVEETLARVRTDREAQALAKLAAEQAHVDALHARELSEQARTDANISLAAARTARQVMILRGAGQKVRRGRIPKQLYPKLIEADYAKAMISHIERARYALAPLGHELHSLLERAKYERGDRFDTGESSRARELIGKARDALKQVTRPNEIESLARTFGQRAQQYNRVQLGRQVKAALGADVFAQDSRIATLLDHYVSENVALITSITPQVIDQIEGIVTRAFTSGQLHRDIAAQISERFSVGESRARVIARDQIGKLYGQTNAFRQQDLGIDSFTWATSEDERVRPEHAELNGKVFRYDDLPSEGLPGTPILCRCSAEPVFTSILSAV